MIAYVRAVCSGIDEYLLQGRGDNAAITVGCRTVYICRITKETGGLSVVFLGKTLSTASPPFRPIHELDEEKRGNRHGNTAQDDVRPSRTYSLYDGIHGRDHRCAERASDKVILIYSRQSSQKRYTTIVLTQAVIEEPCVGKRSTMRVVTVFMHDMFVMPTDKVSDMVSVCGRVPLTDEL